MIIKYVFGVAIVMVVQISCSLEYPDGYFERIKEFEKNWGTCYEDRFSFPKNDTINGLEYLKCNLDGNDILINDQKDEFEGTVSYEFSWITTKPNTTLPGSDIMQNKLHISFINRKYYKEISIVLKYPTDSLNYIVQKTFSQPEFICGSNFIEDSPLFEISTCCTPNGSVKFSTLFSLKESQIIKIDSFNYQLIHDTWHYYLGYSFEEIEITNEVWNENKKIDIRGQLRKSDIFEENLIVKNLKCAIEFELPNE